MKTSYDLTDSKIVVSDFACASNAPSILMCTQFLGLKKPQKWCTLDSHEYVIDVFLGYFFLIVCTPHYVSSAEKVIESVAEKTRQCKK